MPTQAQSEARFEARLGKLQQELRREKGYSERRIADVSSWANQLAKFTNS